MPESWVALVLAVAAGFLVGSINPATILATVLHGDLHQGSGNPGATNVGRVLGLRWGVVVGVLDVLKGLVPTLLALWLGDRFTAYAVGLATVLGHVLSPFLRGRGGKGVATSMGAVLAVFPGFAVVMALVFALVLWATRSVAGSSIGAAGLLGLYAGLAPLPEPVVAGRLWGVSIALLVILRHYDNIRRWARHNAVGDAVFGRRGIIWVRGTDFDKAPSSVWLITSGLNGCNSHPEPTGHWPGPYQIFTARGTFLYGGSWV